MSTSTSVPLKILIIEDSNDDLLLLVSALKRGGFSLNYKHVYNAKDLKAALQSEPWQVVVSDYSLPTFDARQALEIVRPYNIPFFVYSGTISENIAVELMRAGAQDYVMKGNPTRLIPAIHRELDEMARSQEMKLKLQQKEDQLRQSQKMEAIGRLAGGIAHDFNNFLGSMSLMTELILSNIDDGTDIRSDIARIQSMIKGASGLTRQLLLFSKKQATEVVTLDLNQVVEQMQQMFSRVLGSHISFKIEMADKLSPISLDKNQLEQVIMNLIVNARDAMPDGGKLTIRTFNRHFDQEFVADMCNVPPGDYVAMAVEDTGHGIDEATMLHIFEPFFTTKGSNGTGLGLATVFGIVQNSGGFINVRSQIGVGTTFEIYFPVSDKRVDRREIEQKPNGPAKGRHSILIVEDLEAMRDALATHLSQRGHEVFRAEGSKQAFTLCKDNGQIELLLTDLAMPGMDGMELIKQLKKDLPKLKIILMSGYMQNRLSETDLPPSEIQFLNKPFAYSDLAEKIEILFGDSAKL